MVGRYTDIHFSGGSTRSLECYLVREPSLRLTRPLTKIAESGVRPLSTCEEINKAFDVLSGPAASRGGHWKHRLDKLLGFSASGTMKGYMLVLHALLSPHRNKSFTRDEIELKDLNDIGMSFQEREHLLKTLEMAEEEIALVTGIKKSRLQNMIFQACLNPAYMRREPFSRAPDFNDRMSQKDFSDMFHPAFMLQEDHGISIAPFKALPMPVKPAQSGPHIKAATPVVAPALEKVAVILPRPEPKDIYEAEQAFTSGTEVSKRYFGMARDGLNPTQFSLYSRMVLRDSEHRQSLSDAASALGLSPEEARRTYNVAVGIVKAMNNGEHPHPFYVEPIETKQPRRKKHTSSPNMEGKISQYKPKVHIWPKHMDEFKEFIPERGVMKKIWMAVAKSLNAAEAQTVLYMELVPLDRRKTAEQMAIISGQSLEDIVALRKQALQKLKDEIQPTGALANYRIFQFETAEEMAQPENVSPKVQETVLLEDDVPEAVVVAEEPEEPEVPKTSDIMEVAAPTSARDTPPVDWMKRAGPYKYFVPTRGVHLKLWKEALTHLSEGEAQIMIRTDLLPAKYRRPLAEIAEAMNILPAELVNIRNAASAKLKEIVKPQGTLAQQEIFAPISWKEQPAQRPPETFLKDSGADGGVLTQVFEGVRSAEMPRAVATLQKGVLRVSFDIPVSMIHEGQDVFLRTVISDGRARATIEVNGVAVDALGPKTRRRREKTEPGTESVPAPEPGLS